MFIKPVSSAILKLETKDFGAQSSKVTERSKRVDFQKEIQLVPFYRFAAFKVKIQSQWKITDHKK